MSTRVFCVGALAALTAAAACNGSESEPHGSVDMSLVGQAPSGTVYRLRDAAIVVQGPASTTFFFSEEDPNRTHLSATVVVGDYTAFLQEGWRLERLGADGSAHTVQATLLSANPQPFHVSAGGSTVVPLRFRAGEDVVMDQGSFDIVLEVEETPTTPHYCTTNAECGSGQTCCVTGFLGSCQTLAPGQSCPLPDLTVSADTAAASLFISHQTFDANSCALQEGCVSGAGDRRLLNFSTQTPNLGQADVILGDPTQNPGFQFAPCHGHYHFEGYARYELVDATGAITATGHKQAFCLLDSQRISGDRTPQFHCGFQGITAGWSDIYGAGLDCQWIDVTNVPAGQYQLRIAINPDHIISESDYSNNTISLPVTITDDVPPMPVDPAQVVQACPVAGAGGPGRECGWEYAAGQTAVACTPGATVALGCGCGTGTCVGDPMIRVCEGNGPCVASTALALVDDRCGLCPDTSFTCPASGVYTVLTGPYSASSAYTCEIGVH